MDNDGEVAEMRTKGPLEAQAITLTKSTSPITDWAPHLHACLPVLLHNDLPGY